MTAVSLGGLRHRIDIALLPDSADVVLQLDGLAERERHRRRARAQWHAEADCLTASRPS